MKPSVYCGLAVAALFTFSACNHHKEKRDPAATNTNPKQPEIKPGTPTISPDAGGGTTDIKKDDGPKPPSGGVIPPPNPHPNPDYAIKIEGRPGFVTSPYDPEHRPIDARNLPPGTEIEDPYTKGRTLLVP